MASTVGYFCFLLCVLNVSGDYYDTFTGVKISRRRFEEMRNMSLVPWCAIVVAACDPHEYRRMDLSCNNLKYPSFGAIATPFRRLLPADYQDGRRTVRLSASGLPLPPPRALRVALMSDGRAPSHTHTQLLPNIALLNTGDTTSVHDTVNYVIATLNCCVPGGNADPRCAPIAVANDDLHLYASNVRCLNLTTPISYQNLGCLPSDGPLEKFNLAAPMLELSSVYGFEALGAARGRLWEGGRMRSEMLNGKEWPPSGGLVCVNNEPPNETRCHSAPNAGANSLLGVNVVFLWLYRQHNAIARHLSALNPCWGDDRLYYTAREINIAFANQIYYYEFLPEIMGTEYLLKHKVISPDLGHVNDYDVSLEPRLTIEYTVASRWFHTLQEGRLKLYTQNGVLYDEKAIVDFTLRTGALTVNGTLEGITQGTFRQPGAAVDGLVDPDIGMRVLGRLQRVSDVISADLSKGRLLGLAPYVKYRRLCGLPTPHSFQDLAQWMDQEQVDALSQKYEAVEDIDLVAGMSAELPLTQIEKKKHMREKQGHIMTGESEGHLLKEESKGHMLKGESKGHILKGEREGYMMDEEHMMKWKRRMQYWTEDALVGPTLACVLTEQLVRFRRADRYWYEYAERPQPFSKAQLLEIRKISLAALLCRYGDGVTAVQRRPLRLPGHGNELEPCASIELGAPDLAAFADHTCGKHSQRDPFAPFMH